MFENSFLLELKTTQGNCWLIVSEIPQGLDFWLLSLTTLVITFHLSIINEENDKTRTDNLTKFAILPLEKFLFCCSSWKLSIYHSCLQLIIFTIDRSVNYLTYLLVYKTSENSKHRAFLSPNCMKPKKCSFNIEKTANL